MSTTAENLASTGIQSGADAATSVPLALKKWQATKFPRDGSEDERYKDSGDGEERREERAKDEGAFGKANMLGVSPAGSDFSSTHAAFGPNCGSR